MGQVAPTRGSLALWCATTLVGLQALALIGTGLALAVASVVATAQNEIGAIVLALMAAGVGVGLAVCAVGVRRRRSWARGPVVTCQLVLALIAMRLASGVSWWVGLGLLAVAVVVGVLLVGPWVLPPAERFRDPA